MQKPKPNFEHLFKNAYLVHSFEGIKEAAQAQSRNKDVKLTNTFSMEGKYPLIVIISGTREFQNVYMPLTDTTLRFFLSKLEEAQNA